MGLTSGCARPTCKRSHFGRLSPLSLSLILAIIVPLSFSPSEGTAQTSGRLYPETGFTLAQQFLHFFDTHGGVPIFGYPVTTAHQENGYLVQWTERQRLEWHPDNAGTPYEVMLGLLGRELTRGMQGPRFEAAGQPHFPGSGSDSGQAPAAGPSPPQGNGTTTTTTTATTTSNPDTEVRTGPHYFPQTGQYLDDLFYSYWQANGGVPVFGYPISRPYTQDGLQVQWFERARFEIHPENPPETRVLLGQLGSEALQAGDLPRYTLTVDGVPAPDTTLQIGLAQGGESPDPAFFDNIRQQAQALGPGLVRLDNIFDYYNVVRRNPDGTLAYRWDDLDRVLAGVLAMGKEPLLCLSYMPEALSAGGASRVLPPADYAEWASLVSATVRHVNIDMRFGVRYWEVWNEPNQWSFWQAPFPEYLKLYDVTVQAALSADPSIKIGGPAVSLFSPDHIRDLLAHETAQAGGRVDFISWHSYGNSPDQIAADIRQARAILQDYPHFDPQIFITEFNILQGGPGDTSAGGYTDTVEGAVAFLSSIESMQRERLDRAFLFELKDGPGSASYWGKWGILTFDGLPKPVYYALQAYQQRPPGMLPVSVTSGPHDGTLGMMAYGSSARATLLLWYTGFVQARVKVALPAGFDQTYYDVALFDHDTNNPARTGDAGPGLQLQLGINAGDLVFNLKPQSLLVMTTR